LAKTYSIVFKPGNESSLGFIYIMYGSSFSSSLLSSYSFQYVCGACWAWIYALDRRARRLDEFEFGGSLVAGVEDRRLMEISWYCDRRAVKLRRTKIFGSPRTSSLNRSPRALNPVHFYTSRKQRGQFFEKVGRREVLLEGERH